MSEKRVPRAIAVTRDLRTVPFGKTTITLERFDRTLDLKPFKEREERLKNGYGYKSIVLLSPFPIVEKELIL